MTFRITRTSLVFAALLVLAAPFAANALPGDIVVLRGLDKVTARVVTFEAKVGATVMFGTLEITVRSCDRAPPTEPPESIVYFDIYDIRPGEEKTDMFHGFMRSSSPAHNALEHPVYDVWVLECKIVR